MITAPSGFNGMPKLNPLVLKTIFERAVASARFSEPLLHSKTAALRSLPHAVEVSKALSGFLTPAQVETVQRRLTRIAFLVEPVNEDVTSTKYAVRWDPKLAPPDQRGAAFEHCLSIHEVLSRSITEVSGDEGFRSELNLLLEWDRAPHEFFVDYASRTVRPIHSSENLRIFRDPDHVRLLGIRRALLDPKLNPDSRLFEDVFAKVRVKSYLTDRAQTGLYKTNREKRWESHPDSPQFALRRECFAVELQLIDQLFRFENFPPGIIRYLQSEGLLADLGKVARCPVTLDPMDFALLAQEVADPTHGKSAYQVGHLNPLKAGQGAEFRHNKANISWITADGNRIQGHLTLKETRKLLLRISANYDALLKAGEISPP